MARSRNALSPKVFSLRNIAWLPPAVIADTDNANLPMARAFAYVGWPQTETRIDLVPA